MAAEDDLASIRSVRASHEADFRPRSARALARWPVRVSEQRIAGVSCQIVEPVDTPVGAGGGPTILYFFGGGYGSGSPDYDLAITAPLAVLSGCRIVAPRYAVAPENPLPAGLDQCTGVYAALGKDGPLCLSGESAGGGMAMSVTRAAGDAGLPAPLRLALFSPWVALREAATASCEGVDDPTMTGEDLRLFARAYLGDAPTTDPRASPALGTFAAEWPPTLLTTGSRDRLGPMVRALAGRLPTARLIDRAGMWHVFELYDECPEALETLEAAAAFLAEGFARV